MGQAGPVGAEASYPPGLVTTLAGQAGNAGASDGTGQAATFHSPEGLAIDGNTLYVADTLNDLIRKVDLSTGRVSTIAGYPGEAGSADGVGMAASFNQPGNLALDTANGYLYISDTVNDTVRRLSLADDSVITVAGTAGAPGSADGSGAAARFDHPRGIAFDSATTCLYVADSYNQTIRRIGLSGYAVTTVAGSAGVPGDVDGVGNAARFHSPWDLALSSGGHLYVADRANATIRDIAIATWSVSTIAGSPGQTGWQDGVEAAARFDDPRGLATDGTDIYVGDSGNDLIRSITIASGLTSTIAGRAAVSAYADGLGSSALFSSPFCISTGTDTRNLEPCLWVADTGDNTIREIIP